MRNRECMHHILILNTWGSWKPNIHCYKPSAVETMTLLQTLGRRIQQHCCKPSAVEPRHCYGFSAMIPFCGTFPKDSKSTALGLLGYIYIFTSIYNCVYIYVCIYIYVCVCVFVSHLITSYDLEGSLVGDVTDVQNKDMNTIFFAHWGITRARIPSSTLIFNNGPHKCKITLKISQP